MTYSPRHLEGIVREIHDSTAIDCPIDARVLAEACGLTLKVWAKPTGRIDVELGKIWHPQPPKVRAVRMHGLIAHEIGHWLLWRACEQHLDESAARYLAGALMLPRERFLADIARTDWDLFALMELHPNVSAEMVVCRMTQVSPATASVWDSGTLTRSYGGHDASNDVELVATVLEREEPVRGAVVSAWPMFDGSERRVLCVRRAA